MLIYIVIGTREDVYQDTFSAAFTPHFSKEIVKAFYKEDDAIDYIDKCKLKKPKKKAFGDASYYKGGYYDMEIQEVEVN